MKKVFFILMSLVSIIFAAEKILVVGTGYVGLVTGTCLANSGHEVICLDIDREKIDKLNRGIIPIYEPGLEDLVNKNVKENRLRFTTDYADAVKKCPICFLALPTPCKEDGSCDLAYVEKAAAEIASLMDDFHLIINKSTVPVQTGKHVQTIIKKILDERRENIPFEVVSNPEFLREGCALKDCLYPDRIVIGASSEKAFEIMRNVYHHSDKIIEMDILSAEITKYAANAMLATRISFMNEIAGLCKKTGADVEKVKKGIGTDHRIGSYFLNAGIGYGGSCFPKDVKALIDTFKSYNINPNIIEATEKTNFEQKKLLPFYAQDYFSSLEGKTIALWGMAFKPDTDDMREAPSIIIADLLIKMGAKVKAYDPVAMDNAKKVIPYSDQIVWCKDKMQAAAEADAVFLLTEWEEFKNIDWANLKRIMNKPVMFDGRNLYRGKLLNQWGFDHISIGRPSQLLAPKGDELVKALVDQTTN